MRGQPAAEPTDDFELEARQRGHRWIAGLDEAGRGPLAGPVVAAAVMLPRRFHLYGLTDSKQVTAQGREHLYEVIVTRVEVVRQGKVRRAKLYYLRKRKGKMAKVLERDYSPGPKSSSKEHSSAGADAAQAEEGAEATVPVR